jgi:hypothetical protein
LIQTPEEQAKIDQRAHLVQPVLEARHHAEVTAATSQGPEKVRVFIGGRCQDLAVGSDDLGRQEIVAAQARLPGQPAAG